MEIEQWLDFWPGNEHYAPELTWMRRGPLGSFVDFLIENARPESYIEAAEGSRELDGQQQEELMPQYDEDDEPFLEQYIAEAEQLLERLEKEEKERYGRVSEKFESQQAQDYKDTLKQISTKPFLRRINYVAWLEECLSNTTRLQRRVSAFSGVPSKSLSSRKFQNSAQPLNHIKKLFMDTVKETVNSDTSEDSSRFSKRTAVCKALKLYTHNDPAKFWNWWSADLAADLNSVDSTTVENTTLENTMRNMNRSFSIKIKLWTDIHIKVGVGNLEIESERQEVGQRRTSGVSEEIESHELNRVEYYSLLLDHFRQLDTDEFIEELEAISKESISPDTSFLPEDSQIQREIDVEFICVLLKTWPALTFQLQDVMEYGNLALETLHCSGYHLLKVLQKTLSRLTSEEMESSRRNSGHGNRSINKKSKSLPNRIETDL